MQCLYALPTSSRASQVSELSIDNMLPDKFLPSLLRFSTRDFEMSAMLDGPVFIGSSTGLSFGGGTFSTQNNMFGEPGGFWVVGEDGDLLHVFEP